MTYTSIAYNSSAPVFGQCQKPGGDYLAYP